MAIKQCLLFVIFNFCLISIEGQTMMHQLKYVNQGENFSPATPAQFTSNPAMTPEDQLSNTRNRFAKAERICVSGMWALYNTTFYGQGAEDTTTVISVRGTDIQTCTKPGQIPASVLTSIQSVRYLGNPDYDMDGLVIYSQPYMLGATWDLALLPVLPTGINGFPLGSLAITGQKSWLICGDNDVPCSKGVCVDLRNYGKLFMQRNALKEGSLPNGWPRVVRKVETVTLEQCSHYPNPAPVKSRKRSAPKNGRVDEDDIKITISGASSGKKRRQLASGSS